MADAVILKLDPLKWPEAKELPPWDMGGVDPRTGLPPVPTGAAPPDPLRKMDEDITGAGKAIGDIVRGVDKGLGGLVTEALNAAGLSTADPTKAPAFSEGVAGGAQAFVGDSFRAYVWYGVFGLAAVAVLVFGAARLFR